MTHTTMTHTATCRIAKLKSTISRDEAGAEQWDAVVIGAGPAGSTAAFCLANSGFSTLLLDRVGLPRSKVCGCCLGPWGGKVLDQLGLGWVLEDAGSITNVQWRVHDRACTIPSRGFRVIDRGVLDTRLAIAARNAGAMLLWDAPGRVGRDNTVELRGSGSRRVLCARTIIVADGLGGSSLRDHPAFTQQIAQKSLQGIGTTLASSPIRLGEGTLAMVCDRDGYVGLVELPDGSCDVAAALKPEALRESKSPAALIGSILGQSCENKSDCDVESLVQARWKGTPMLTRSRSPVASQRVFVAGDAAGYVEPFTGEGMSIALESGREVAAVVGAYLQHTSCPQQRESRAAQAAQIWNAQHTKIVRSSQQRCRIVARGLRSQLLARATCSLVAHIPTIGESVSRVFGSPPRNILWQPQVHTAKRDASSRPSSQIL